MAVKFMSAKCPECGAMLPVEEGCSRMFCSFCGSQIIMNNENEQIYRHIDEAEVKKIEAGEAIQLKKLELLEKKQQADERSKKTRILISIPLMAIGILFMLIGSVGNIDGLEATGGICITIVMYIWIFSAFKHSGEDNEIEENIDIEGKVKVPAGAFNYVGRNYTTIENMFENAGFTNVKCVPLNDLTFGILNKPGTVEAVTVNGKVIKSSGKKYSANARVVISYHSH